jgi:hypothetical protein
MPRRRDIAKESKLSRHFTGETGMRPWVLMGSAVGIALLMVIALLLPAGISVYRQFVYGGAAPKYYAEGAVIVRRELDPIGRIVPRMRTTVEHPGGVNLPSQRNGDFTCVTLFSAPRTMEVGDTAAVETDLLTTTDRGKVDALMSAVQHVADALNKRIPFPSTATSTSALALAELDPEAADAIRRMKLDETGDRQAAADTLPGSPIMTAHLTGPGFEITPDTPERQAVTTKTPAIWRWTIKAVDPGERNLTVSYSAEVLVADQRVPRSLRTISRTVVVSVAPAGLLKEAAEKTSSVKSIAENVSWIWTTLIFPAAMFLYGLRKWFTERHAGTPQPTGGG